MIDSEQFASGDDILKTSLKSGSARRCPAEIIYPAGQIDRCERSKHKDYVHTVTHDAGLWMWWFGGFGRLRGWEEAQTGFKAGWKAATGNSDYPLFERGPAFTGIAR